MDENRMGSRAAEVVRRAVASIDRHPLALSGVIVVRTLDYDYRIRPVWAGEGFPLDIRQALDSAEVTGDDAVVVVAARMSPGARELVEAKGLSWADEAGHARILIPPALAVVLAPPRSVAKQSPSFRWSASAGATAEVLLDEFGTRDAALPPATSIAAPLSWSVPQVSRVLQTFDAQGWTQKHGSARGPASARSMTDPSAMLSSWARWHSARTPETVQLHALWRDPRDFATLTLAKHLPSHAWCLTGLMAAAELAPYAMRVVDISCYLDEDVWNNSLPSLLTELESIPSVRVVDTGARLRLIKAERHVLTLASSGPLPLSAPVRIYADLLAAGGRSQEAAEHLRETVLGI